MSSSELEIVEWMLSKIDASLSLALFNLRFFLMINFLLPISEEITVEISLVFRGSFLAYYDRLVMSLDSSTNPIAMPSFLTCFLSFAFR